MPEPLALVVPCSPSLNTSTPLFATAVPLINNWLSLVISSVLLLPVSLVMLVTAGAAGAVVSTVMSSAVDSTPLPATRSGMPPRASRRWRAMSMLKVPPIITCPCRVASPGPACRCVHVIEQRRSPPPRRSGNRQARRILGQVVTVGPCRARRRTCPQRQVHTRRCGHAGSSLPRSWLMRRRCCPPCRWRRRV